MNVLRLVLLGLAIVMLTAIGWRVIVADRPEQPRQRVVAANPAALPAPAPPKVAPPPTPPAPVAPASPALPTAPTAPKSVTQPTVPTPPASLPGAAEVPATTPPPADSARASVEAHLQTAPDLARVFDLLKAEFPAVADRSLTAAAETLRTKGSLPSPDDVVAGAMRDARLSAGVLAARAGPEALAAIFDVKAATLADLEAADPRICADYVYGGTSPEFNDFAVTHRALVARSDIATLAAMADGRRRQMSWDTPSPEDYAMIETTLKAKGLSADEIAAVLDGKSLDTPPSDTRLCDNARSYLDAMRAMPPDARNRVYGLAAELLARS